jgi:hypothetical protein
MTLDISEGFLCVYKEQPWQYTNCKLDYSDNQSVAAFELLHKEKYASISGLVLITNFQHEIPL